MEIAMELPEVQRDQSPKRRLIYKRERRQRVPLSDSTVDRLEKAGQFPRRVRISTQRVAWFEDEIEAWLERHADAR